MLGIPAKYKPKIVMYGKSHNTYVVVRFGTLEYKIGLIGCVWYYVGDKRKCADIYSIEIKNSIVIATEIDGKTYLKGA